jgi:hypothetical protein
MERLGLQRLLRLASVEPAFLEQLLALRDGAAKAAGVRLAPSEAAVLRALPAERLEEMVRVLPPPAPERRAFLRRTAATAVVLLGGAVLAECVPSCAKHEVPTGSLSAPEAATAATAADAEVAGPADAAEESSAPTDVADGGAEEPSEPTDATEGAAEEPLEAIDSGPDVGGSPDASVDGGPEEPDVASADGDEFEAMEARWQGDDADRSGRPDRTPQDAGVRPDVRLIVGGARPDTPSYPSPHPSGTPDRDEVRRVLASITDRVGTCLGGAAGSVSVSLTIQGSSGDVSSAHVMGDVDAAQRSCIEALCRELRFPTFSNPAQTVSYTYRY